MMGNKMNLLDQYPNALEQLEILKKDFLGVDNEEELRYSVRVEANKENDMDYMTLAAVIEDLEELHSVKDIEALMEKYAAEMERIEAQMASAFDLEIDDGA
jgi:hypothetical protein